MEGPKQRARSLPFVGLDSLLTCVICIEKGPRADQGLASCDPPKTRLNQRHRAQAAAADRSSRAMRRQAIRRDLFAS